MLYVDPISQRFSSSDMAVGQDGRKKYAMQELEHFFLYTLLKQMRSSTINAGLFERSSATKMYDDLLDDAMAKHMAESGQMGIARLLEQQLQQQEMQRQVTPISEEGSTVGDALKSLGPSADKQQWVGSYPNSGENYGYFG